METNLKGFILYKGPSRLDKNTNIVCIVTSTTNRKTGNMLQTWILNENLHPVEANRTGKDMAVCGNCPHRGVANSNGTGMATKRTCYVMPMTIANVWKSYKRGNYIPYDSNTHDEILKSTPVRFGSFGEFAALPFDVLKKVVKLTPSWTMYTHQWKKIPKSYSQYSMASVDSFLEKIEANKLGYRTFRVLAKNEKLEKDELLCPASNEFEELKGYRLTCQKCRLCCGTTRKAKNIAIFAHGTAKNYIQHTSNPGLGILS